MTRAIVFDCNGVLDTDGFYAELLPLIKHLHGRYRLAVLSNGSQEYLVKFLSEHQIRPYFDVILASSQTRFLKPQREIFEVMSERLDLPFADMLFIDDTPVNTAAAKSYGLTAVTYRDPSQLRDALHAHNIQV